MPWITTKTGKRINTDWFDEERKKQQQIGANKREADAASGKSHAPQIHDLMGQDAYVNSPEYMAAMGEWQSLQKERDSLKARMQELWDIKDKGSTIQDEDLKAFGGDRNLAALFAKKSPEAEAAEKELKDIYKRQEELQSSSERAYGKVTALDKAAADRQKAQFDEDWKAGRLTMAKQSQKDYRGFELDTHTTHYQELQKKGEAMIMEMAPKEYLQRCAVEIFGSTYERQVRAAEADADHTFDLVSKMRSGTKMYLPVLNYAEKEQEGRHRAVAAMLLGIEKIPVLVVPKKRRG